MQKIIDINNGITRMPDWRMREPVNFTLCDGENIAIMGPNGGGKSMFVDILTGKHPLLGDAIKYDFAPSTHQYISDNIKYVCFKDTYGGDNDSTYYLQQRWNQTEIDPETATVGSRLESEYNAAGENTEERRALQKHIYNLFGLDSLLDKYVILLSSGELRKMVIASSIFSQPRLLIIDNPYIGLDKEARIQLTNLLQTLSTEHGIQIMLVVNRTKDIPEFITHVVEVSDMTVGEKLTREEYMKKSDKALTDNKTENTENKVEKTDNNDSTTDDELETTEKSATDLLSKILNLPYKSEEYHATNVVDMHGVNIRYGERTILKDLDWTVRNGEHWALTGRNGSGKSTLLSLVCADNPQSYACDITLFDRARGSGESIWDIKKHIGYVSPEMHRAFRSNVTTERIVASGFSNAVSLYVKPDPKHHATCLFWMRVFGIEHLAQQSFLKLSSGEQRLVLLARAMVKDPELLILDEPLHGLDEPNRRRVKKIIETFCCRENKTLIMVTHYEEELPNCIDHRKVLIRN